MIAGSMAPSTLGRCMQGTLTSALFLLSCWALPDPRQVGGPAGPWCWGSPGAENPDSPRAQGWVPWGVKGCPIALGQRGRKSERGVQGTIGLPGDGVGLSAVRLMLRADAVPATPVRPGPLSCPSACSPHFPSLCPLTPQCCLSVSQQFLQALEPGDVTSYFGPDAAFEGTCPGGPPCKGSFSEPPGVGGGRGISPLSQGARLFGGCPGRKSEAPLSLLINSGPVCQVDKDWSGCSGRAGALTLGVYSVSRGNGHSSAGLSQPGASPGTTGSGSPAGFWPGCKHLRFL